MLKCAWGLTYEYTLNLIHDHSHTYKVRCVFTHVETQAPAPELMFILLRRDIISTHEINYLFSFHNGRQLQVFLIQRPIRWIIYCLCAWCGVDNHSSSQSMPFMEAAILKLIPKSNSYLRFFKRKKLKKCCFKATLLLKEKQKYLLLLFLDLIFIFVNIEFENISECAGFFFFVFFLAITKLIKISGENMTSSDEGKLFDRLVECPANSVIVFTL